MKTPLLLPALVLGAALQFGCASRQPGGLHVPPEGSPERKAIVDGMRVHLRAQGAPARRLVVRTIKEHAGWSWLSVDPQSGAEKFETVSGLLHLETGAWKVKALQPAFGEVEATDPTYQKWFAALKKKYPDAPADIFPQ